VTSIVTNVAEEGEMPIAGFVKKVSMKRAMVLSLALVMVLSAVAMATGTSFPLGGVFL
jgi:fucose permease